MEISDSDDEEIPEWAEDIMDDLAIIAKGEIPPSLKEKKKEKEKKTKKKKKGKTAPTESISKTSKQGTDINETEIPRDDLEGNVFVRLTAPENFTGAQKKAFSERQSRVPPEQRSVAKDWPLLTTTIAASWVSRVAELKEEVGDPSRYYLPKGFGPKSCNLKSEDLEQECTKRGLSKTGKKRSEPIARNTVCLTPTGPRCQMSE